MGYAVKLQKGGLTEFEIVHKNGNRGTWVNTGVKAGNNYYDIIGYGDGYTSYAYSAHLSNYPNTNNNWQYYFVVKVETDNIIWFFQNISDWYMPCTIKITRFASVKEHNLLV